MPTTVQALQDRVASDLMSRKVITIPQDMPLREAAGVLSRHRISAAPVVDESGQYVGLLCTADFIHWAEEHGPAAAAFACPYRVQGRLLTGEEAAICTLMHGGCPWQASRPLTGGRHAEVCVKPPGVLGPFEIPGQAPAGAVRCYARTQVVTVGPNTPLPVVARALLEAHVPQVVVVDDLQPIGIISLSDIVAAVAVAGC